ncbi:MAG: hypothetical protein HY530_01185 [Chloroflexi bacterium]|nr:hypothetical protein [Chloroflexota bacterium]
MQDNQVSPAESERLQSIISLLGIGEVVCDKCGRTIKHQDRYCYSIHECPTCSTVFDSLTELHSHFSQQHPRDVSRGARYCVECSLKAGFLKMVRSKKTAEVFPATCVLRDEEETEAA